MAGKFITIEGIDGSGKTTQAGRIAQWLEVRTGRETIRTFEPGGWEDGESFREIILHRKFCALSELLLFLADRSEHVNRVILPALLEGKNVVCERWNVSTMAYQAGGHELDPLQVGRIISACDFPEPDAKIFLDIPPELAIERIKSRANHDKFESEGLALMNRVAKSYRLFSDDMRMTRINCAGLSEDDVFDAVILSLEENLWQSR